MADIQEARVVGDWRRIVGDYISSHEVAEGDDIGVNGTVTLTPTFSKGGPQGVLGTPDAFYSPHTLTCKVLWGQLHDGDLNNPWQDIVVSVDGNPLVWTAAFSLTYKARPDQQAQKIVIHPVTFDHTAIAGGNISLTSLIPAAAVPPAYQSHFVNAQASAVAADAAKVTAVGAASTASTAASTATGAAGTATTKAAAAAESATLAGTEAAKAVGLASAQDTAIAGRVTDPASATHAAFKAVGNATYQPVGDYAGVDVRPTGTEAGDKAAVIAASLAAKNAGRGTVRLADGTWRLDALTPTDIHDRTLTLDKGTFTPGSFVAPLRPESVDEVVRNHGRQAGGRGRIAFEVDDSTPEQWSKLFPITQRLGIPYSVAWITGRADTVWAREAHRRGWELSAHLPTATTATAHLTAGTLDAACQASVDAVAAITGNPRDVGLIYPEHSRSLETDRVCSKYFTRGRGVTSDRIYPSGMPRPWLTHASQIDGDFEGNGGKISTRVRRILDRVATADGGIVFYHHWHSLYGPEAESALADMVAYARHLGIEIVTPSQIWRRRGAVDDPYFEDPARWTLTASGGATAEWDTTSPSYHRPRTVKVTPAATAGSSAVVLGDQTGIPSRPGHFSVWRFSIRRKATAPAYFGYQQGMIFGAAMFRPVISGQVVATAYGTPQLQTIPTVSLGGSNLPVSDFGREQILAYFDPAVDRIQPRVQFANMPAGGPTQWLDEFKVELVDYVTSVTLTATLAGGANVVVPSPVADAASQIVDWKVMSPTTGVVTVTVSNNQVLVKSDNGADVGQQVRVTFRPKESSYLSNALTPDGA